MTLEDDVLPRLRCPRTRTPLVREHDTLVAVGAGAAGERYPIVERIPVLLTDIPGRQDIIRAFHSRSTSYYRDNYLASGNPERRARQDLVAGMLHDLVQPDARVLEAGAGPAALGTQIMALTSRYVALDLSLDNLLAGRQRLGDLDSVVGDLSCLPFVDQSFDVVLAIGCLEYVRELPLAIAELVRVTALGGTVLATFANAASPRRWWEERIAYTALRATHRLRGADRSQYPRWLHNRSAIARHFNSSGAAFELVHFYGSAVAGYPATRAQAVRRADRAVANHVPGLLERSGEFLVRARRSA